MPKRSKKFVFVPFCLQCQAFQAQGIVKYDWSSSIQPIINKLMEKDINIIQLPCPESFFNEYDNIVREPKGLKHYNNEYFIDHCEKLAQEQLKLIKSIIDNNYEIVAIMGIENSPTCAVSFIYTNKGMENRKGIFMESLFKQLSNNNIDIPFIGINRKSIKKSMALLDNL